MEKKTVKPWSNRAVQWVPDGATRKHLISDTPADWLEGWHAWPPNVEVNVPQMVDQGEESPGETEIV